MSVIRDRIARHAAREAELIGQISDGFAREAARVFRQVERDIGRLLAAFERDATGRYVVTSETLAQALRLRGNLRGALETAGYDELIAASLDDPFDRLTVQAVRGRAIVGRASALTADDVDVLMAWRSVRQADLLELGDDIVTGVWSATVDGMLGARDPQDLTAELASMLDRSEAQARTVYDTAASVYSRQVDQVGLQPEPGDRFLYVGPVDKVTRPFCRQHAGQVMTREELDGVSNGQIPNTLATGGGWNCRHKWLFVGGADIEAES